MKEKRQTEKWLVWEGGKLLTLQELQQITGLSLTRQSMARRLHNARDKGFSVATLHEQIDFLMGRSVVRRMTTKPTTPQSP